jgi:hypothetical protein
MNSTALQTIGSFEVTRVSKAGKETKRDFVGVVSSGNRAERQQALQSLITHHYCEGQFTMLAKNMTRIFGDTFVGNAAFVGLNSVTGGALDKNKKTARAAWQDMVSGLQGKHAVKPYKGEKLQWLECLNNAVKTYDLRQASLQAQADAMQPAGDAIEVTATEAQALALPAPASDEDATVNADATPV